MCFGYFNLYSPSRGKISLWDHTYTCAYQGVRNVSFSKNFVYVLNEWSLLEIIQNCDIYSQMKRYPIGIRK